MKRFPFRSLLTDFLFDRYQDTSLNRLQIEFHCVGYCATCKNFPLDMLLTLIVELDSSTSDWWGTLFERWCQVNILGNNTFVQERDHALVDVIF